MQLPSASDSAFPHVHLDIGWVLCKSQPPPPTTGPTDAFKQRLAKDVGEAAGIHVHIGKLEVATLDVQSSGNLNKDVEDLTAKFVGLAKKYNLLVLVDGSVPLWTIPHIMAYTEYLQKNPMVLLDQDKDEANLFFGIVVPVEDEKKKVVRYQVLT